jgi:hypothetical protein
MRAHFTSSSAFVGALSLVFLAPLPLVAQAPGSATGTLTVAGKSVSLTHAVAFNSGARIYLLITDQALPPDEVTSEFKLAIYQFTHHVTGLELTLDPAHKVTEVAYRWELTKKPCPGCFEVALSGGPNGPLTGSMKTTAKGEASEKMKAEVTFSAPFAQPSGAKRQTP